MPLLDRLMSRTDRSGECWLWTGSTYGANRANPGAFSYGKVGYGGKYYSAHRLSWIAHKGDIPEGMAILHKCDNPKCINPDHLELGTQLDNIADRQAKGRQCKKLSADDVAAIRAAVAPQKEIAARYGVSRAYVSQLRGRVRRVGG